MEDFIGVLALSINSFLDHTRVTVRLSYIRRLVSLSYPALLGFSICLTDHDPAMASIPTMAAVRSIHKKERDEKHSMDETPIAYGVDDEVRPSTPIADGSSQPLFDSTHRKLKPRHIQLIGIGGCVNSTPHNGTIMEDAC